MTRARLEEVLRPVERAVTVVPTDTYRIVGVRSFGGGCFASAEIVGAETRYTRLLRVATGDFVYPKLMAWEGAFAVVPIELDGRFVSPEFCTFEVDESRLDRRYLELLFQRPETWSEIAGDSSGTNVRRRRLYPRDFLTRWIPLPQLKEQQRIADRLTHLHSLIELARYRSEDGTKAGDALRWSILRAEFERLEREWGSVPLEQAAAINPESVKPDHFGDREFFYVDIGSIKNGTGQIANARPILAADAPSRARRRIRRGDVLVSTVRPNLRGVGLVTDELDGQVCSTGFAVLRPASGVESEFMLLQMMSDTVVDQLVSATRGGHYPAVNDAALRAVKVVIPPTDAQKASVSRLENLFSSAVSLATRLVRQREELEALRLASLNAAFNGPM